VRRDGKGGQPKGAVIDPELEAAMHERARAERDGDVESFARLTADNFVLINARGQLLDKNARVAQVTTGAPRTEAVSGAERVRMFGDGTAIRTRLATRPDGEVRITTIWVKEDGQWRVASAHVTRVAG
jgi:ketosteroid isomerase-like protein